MEGWRWRDDVLQRTREESASEMKQAIPWIAGILLFAMAVGAAGEKRVSLLPKLQPGQKLTYLIRFRSDKTVKTESMVAAPLAPDPVQMDAHGLLQMEVLDVQKEGGKVSIHARGQFRTLDSGASMKKPGDKEPREQAQREDSGEKSIEFTISPDGSVRQVSGLDSLSPEQQQAWQEWVARFAVAWTLPADGARIGEKWKSEQAEQARAPIALLNWERESQYVKNEPCRASQLSISGEASRATGAADTCAVLLTTATLKQKSSPKDATPEDFKLHELKTMGTAKGTNEIITYISLQSGLVVRATEEASQAMDVTVAKSDGSNGVHYKVDAKSHAEVLLVTETPLNRP
jgi:hypothetical protein